MSFNMQSYLDYDTNPEYHNIKQCMCQFHISGDVSSSQSYFLVYCPIGNVTILD